MCFYLDLFKMSPDCFLVAADLTQIGADRDAKLEDDDPIKERQQNRWLRLTPED